MAIDDASTALAPAATSSDHSLSTGAKRFPRGLAAGLAHCTEHGWRFRRFAAHGARLLPAVTIPGAAAHRARPSGLSNTALHP